MSEARRHKSRAGCQQCKRRKVKCDLGVPTCRQCHRQKLQCPGYQKPLKWVGVDTASTSRLSNQRSPPRTPEPPLSTTRTSKSSSGNGSYIAGSSLGEPLHDDSSALIHHYFTRVCRIAGCFDSDVSPFRIIPASMISNSKPIFLLVQASSAAQLSRQNPQMRVKALSLQTEAFSAVRDEIGKLQGFNVSDELMLSSIFAGLTSAWYDVNDIGLSHVFGSQVLLSLWLMSRTERLRYQQTFILGAYIYWFMISSFAAGDPWQSFHYQEALQKTVRNLEMSHDIADDTDVPEEQRKIYPHPLTGFSNDLCLTIGKVGSLCRLRYSPSGNLRDFLEDNAQIIEAELLGLRDFPRSNFHDPQDPNTSVEEILSVREAYRCSGLLQLYATFPHLLHRQEHQSLNPSQDIPVEPQSETSASQKAISPPQYNFLRALSIHILSMLATIPSTSGTRVLQGLPVLIAATWLVDPHPSTSDIFQHPLLPIDEPSSTKEPWREIVREGLRAHNENVGLQQVSRVLDIVEEVWRIDDRGGEKCAWMVVVASKGLQTLYG
ncbi:fungal-specific transcription factor domain-containing protein [Rhexocercosporidium sp. MPI-PUGE-AT-0058]|nr:fungal-specific transcription factor domain-containing protein [Rhexocercosporidium sp. MPI-PUGE-AT-0058]